MFTLVYSFHCAAWNADTV